MPQWACQSASVDGTPGLARLAAKPTGTGEFQAEPQGQQGRPVPWLPASVVSRGLIGASACRRFDTPG